MQDELIFIDDRMRRSLVETETGINDRLKKFRSRLETPSGQSNFDFSLFIAEVENYMGALGTVRELHVVKRDDKNLTMILDTKPLGKLASDVASHLMTNATAYDSRLRHDLLSYIWLVNLAFDLAQTLQARIAAQSRGSRESPSRP